MNKEQAKSLSNFWMEIAKGVVLGMFGFTAVTNTSVELKVFNNILALIFAYFCIKVGLQLLEGYDTN